MAEPPRAKPPRPPQGTQEAPGYGLALVFWTISGVAFSAVGLVTLGIGVFGQYGFSLFLLIPLTVGFASAWLTNRNRPWHWPLTIGIVSLTLSLTGFLMLGFEGIFCLLMASGLAVVLAGIGTLIAWIIGKITGNQKLTLLLLVTVCPLSMGLEYQFPPAPLLLTQTTAIEINAPPEVVWRYIPAFPEITQPPYGILATGMAYPVASTLRGEGVGAERSCILSTGTMPERITRWEPGRALEFDVLHTPPAMEETNPFFHIHPPHLEGYFTVTHGRFILTPLDNGRTRVEGTSWFRHDLWPQFYWAPITRHTVKAIHERVLTHIKHLSETSVAR